MSLRVLRWATVVLPVLFLGALDLVRHVILPGTLHSLAGTAAIALVVVSSTAVFSHLVFGAVARMQRRIDEQTRQLAALYEEAQRRSVHLDQLINSSGDAIITTDLEGRIRTWSTGAEAIYGFARAEALGQILPMVPSDRGDEVQALFARVRAGETVTNFETVRRHQSGRRLVVVVTVSPVRGPGGEVVGVMGVSKDLTDKRRLEQQERRLALLEEREHIAMDLHDGAIQSLYAVGLRLEAAGRLAARPGPASPDGLPLVLEQAVDELNRVIQDIRDYVRGLGPRELAAHGLVEGLETLLTDLRDTALIEGRLTIGAPAAALAGQLDGMQTGHLLQMAREALSNVARHAAATTVAVELSAANADLQLVIRDDGRGFDPQTVPPGGRGLRNLMERAAALGGRTTITSAAGQGTTVRVAVPAPAHLPATAGSGDYREGGGE